MGIKQNRKKIIVVLLIFLISTAGVTLCDYYLNKPRNLNVLLITIDSLRPDHLGCYGYRRNTSPNIDKFARKGVLFTQAISQGPETVSSLPSLMTTLYPGEHGVATILRTYIISRPVLAQILKKNYYYTGAICSRSLSQTGLSKGFDSVDFDNDIKTDTLTQKAINWLYKNKDKKFFLWLHYLGPHGPYRPLPPYNKKYLYDNLYKQNKNIPISGSREAIYFEPGKIPLFIAENGITDIDYYIAQYDGAISFTDEQIGILLNKIEELGLDKKTVIILTADHGESLGEHNVYFTHGENLYDEVIKVPLIFKCNNTFLPNKIIDHQVGLIDIMPTIFGLLKIKTKIKMEGINLIPFVLKQNSYFPRKIIFSELFPDSVNHSKIKILNTSLRTLGWKLIYNSQSEKYELYNLKKDPAESTNLIGIEKEQFNFLKAKLEKWMNRPRPHIIPLTKPLDEETKKGLKSLGYLQ